MTHPYFFGYGSLVNRATHDYRQAQTARLSGWRRVWRHTDRQPRPFLTVEPDPDCVIHGLIAQVPNADWAALDAREAGYDRVTVSTSVDLIANNSRAQQIATYTVPEGKHARPTDDLPIVLSYLDTVVQGYLTEFGEAGAIAFFETTRGWDAPFLDDRDDPIYARAQQIGADERCFVDDQIRGLSARVHKRH